jgi:copper chaperone
VIIALNYQLNGTYKRKGNHKLDYIQKRKRGNIMKKVSCLVVLLSLNTIFVSNSWATEPVPSKAESHTNINKLLAGLNKFEIRADGLACTYCAYGIEKKFKEINGVKDIDVDLKKGLVIVSTEPSVTFNEQQLKTLFNDSGFTYRSMKKTSQNAPTKKSNEQQ